MADLLDRCCDAYDEAVLSVSPDDYDTSDHHVAMAAVLRLFAAEILEHHHRASARDVAQMLLEEAAGAAPVPSPEDEEPETWATHPSLTPAERNPSLR